MWWEPTWVGMPVGPIFMNLMVIVCVAMMAMMMRCGMQPPWHRHSDGPGNPARDILTNAMRAARSTRMNMRTRGVM